MRSAMLQSVRRTLSDFSRKKGTEGTESHRTSETPRRATRQMYRRMLSHGFMFGALPQSMGVTLSKFSGVGGIEENESYRTRQTQRGSSRGMQQMEERMLLTSMFSILLQGVDAGRKGSVEVASYRDVFGGTGLWAGSCHSVACSYQICIGTSPNTISSFPKHTYEGRGNMHLPTI